MSRMEARRASGLSTVEWNLLLGGLVLLAAAVAGALAPRTPRHSAACSARAGIVTLALCAAWRARPDPPRRPDGVAARVGRARAGADRGRPRLRRRHDRVRARAPLRRGGRAGRARRVDVAAGRRWCSCSAAVCAIATSPRRSPVDDYRWPRQSEEATELLRRLCMRADMVDPGADRRARRRRRTPATARGRIHVTLPLDRAARPPRARGRDRPRGRPPRPPRRRGDGDLLRAEPRPAGLRGPGRAAPRFSVQGVRVLPPDRS